MYSDNSLSLCLDNYWELYEGILPGDAGSSRPESSPYESAACLKADLDKAIDSLTSDHRWARTVEAMDAYSSDGGDPRDLFFDGPAWFHKLSKWQKAIVIYHLKVDPVTRTRNDPRSAYDQDESFNALVARTMMLKFLNAPASRSPAPSASPHPSG